MKLYITKADDRDMLCMILSRYGYVVRQDKEKSAGEKASKSYVEVLTKDDIQRRSAPD